MWRTCSSGFKKSRSIQASLTSSIVFIVLPGHFRGFIFFFSFSRDKFVMFISIFGVAKYEEISVNRNK